MRALLTFDGYLFLNTSDGVWTDGDLSYGDCEIWFASLDHGTLINDVNTRPDLAERVARIIETV